MCGAVAPDWRIEPLSPAHRRRYFECGEPSLDDYLAGGAWQEQEAGVARTFVALEGESPGHAIGFYTVGAALIAPSVLSRGGAKAPIPMARLSRLAVDGAVQGEGLGEHLLMDALVRIRGAAAGARLVGVVVDAPHATARRFLLRYDFERFPGRPLLLWLPIAAIRKIRLAAAGSPPAAPRRSADAAY
jgi:GNAT superfamily N-acetyltransferase